ncbi:MAG: SGNH/GDSL hydrolase family protein [Pseudolabrys sp.]
MARRITPTHPLRRAGLIGAVLIGVLIGPAGAQAPPPMPLSKACQPGASADTDQSPLPNVTAALAQRKTLRILAFGAAPGRVSAHQGGYTTLIERMLAHALNGIDVVMINRGVSGELAAGAAIRMKNEVALEEPDLVLWQVGTNDALAGVETAEFAATVKDQIDWLKAHKVDVVLVGLQFAKEMLRDAHYIDIRESLRRVAAQENVIVIRFFEAMQIINQAQAAGPEPVAQEFSRDEAGYNCLAQYVARAITLGVFAKNMPKRPAP